MDEKRKDRVGDRCWYKVKKEESWMGGTLMAWSTHYDESKPSLKLFPVAVVVDDKTSRVHSVFVENVSFGTIP